MKLLQQDDVKRMEGIAETILNGDRIRIAVNETCYYSIAIDKETNSIRVYKSGFPDDRIEITLHGANVMFFK